MAEYKIVRVSANDPRSWNFTDKRTGDTVPMLTYKVMVEGEDDPVDVNRKADSKAPEVNELLTGNLESTEFGKRFKAEKKPFVPGQKDQPSIRAQWAIGQAVQIEIAYIKTYTEFSFARIEDKAKQMFAMVEIVKSSAPEQRTGLEKAREAAQTIKNKDAEHFSDGSPVDSVIPVGDDIINLDDIPF